MAEPEQVEIKDPEWALKVGNQISNIFEALVSMAQGAHRIDCTAMGQDLRPIFRATIELAKTAFPPGSTPHTMALDVERELRRAIVATTPNQRREGSMN